MALRFVSFCLEICSWCDVFLTFLSGEGRIPSLIPPTVTTEAAVGFGVIVCSAGLLLAAVATVAIASRDDVAADSGREVSLDLFLWDSRRTC